VSRSLCVFPFPLQNGACLSQTGYKRYETDPVMYHQADKLQSLITAAKVPDVEPIWTTLFAKALEGKDVKDMLMSTGGGSAAAAPAAVAAAPAAAGGAAAEAAPAAEEKKKEEGASQEDLFRSRYFSKGFTDELFQPRRSPTRTWASVSSTKRAISTSMESARVALASHCAKVSAGVCIAWLR